MEELRWILLGFGILIIVGVYYFGDRARQHSSKPKEKLKPAQRREPGDQDFEQQVDQLGALLNGERTQASEHLDPTNSQIETDPSVQSTESAPDRIVTLFLRPRGDARISGPAIFNAAEKVGLDFGEMNIFHRMHEIAGSKVSVFSLADMTKPGSFDPSIVGQVSCQGLCLFLTLPNHLPALDALDAMLAAGQRLADLLDAQLLDDAQSTLIRQRIVQMREEMRVYDRQHGPLSPTL